MTNTISAGAAVAAALFSILNIVLTSRFARQAQVQQWRRESARQSFMDLLEAARKAFDAKGELARRFEPSSKQRQKVWSAKKGPEFELTAGLLRDEKDGDAVIHAAKMIETLLSRLEELELIASADCIAAARAFVGAIDQGMPRTVIEDDDTEGKVDAFMAHIKVYDRARRAFVLACRRDLGVGRGRNNELA